MSGSASYRVCVQGAIDYGWAGQFAGMVLTYEDAATLRARTVLTGKLPDQAGLIGLLNRLYGLGLPLVSVQWLGQRQEAPQCVADDA